MRKLLAFAFISFTLFGCASVPMGDANRDTELKTFAAPADKTGIYIYRNESMGAVATMDVELNGQPIGKTAAKTYLYKEVPPGNYTLTSKAENADSIQIEAKPGELVYIWQEVKMGMFMARSKLHLVDESKGQKGVSECKLAATY